MIPAYLLALCLGGCYYDKEELLYPGACDPGSATTPGYWASTIEPIIATRCANCHLPGGQGPGDLRTYAAVKATVALPEVRARIEGTGSLVVANTPAEFAAQAAAEFEVYKKVVAAQKLKLD